MFSDFIKSQLYVRKSPNLKKLGFDFLSSNHEQEYYKIQQLLVTKYSIECESMLTIMKDFKIPSSRTMDILFRLFDIEARSLSEASTNALLQGRAEIHSTTFTQCWHTTWEGKQAFLRSTYEIKFAESLDLAKIRYESEAFRIRYFDSAQKRFRVAVPDFYLPDTNTIVEIKSHYWYDELNMISKFEEYKRLGFQTKLILDFKEFDLVGAQRVEL